MLSKRAFCLVVLPMVIGCDPPTQLSDLGADALRDKGPIREGNLHLMPIEQVFTTEPAVSLARAVQVGDLDRVRRLVSTGTPVDVKGYQGATPIYWALRTGAAQSFRLLLELGADPNGILENGSTVLHMSVVNPNPIYLAMLLRAGANPNLREPGDLQLTPLFYAIPVNSTLGDFDRVRMLVEAGADVNRTSGLGGVVLLDAAAAMRYDIVFYLLTLGADPGADNDDKGSLGSYIEYHDRTFRDNAKQRLWLEKVKALLSK